MKNTTAIILKSRAPFYAAALAILLGIAGNNIAQAAGYQESGGPIEMNHSHGNGHTHDDQSLTGRAGD